MARRIGDPDLVIGALLDRYQTPGSRLDLDARARAADEIVELSRRIGRRDHELVGLEWQYTSRLSRGDLQGALATLDELETRAQLMPSPLWRYVAATRRVGVLAFSGDRDGAIDLAHRASELAVDLLPPEEVSGLEAGGVLSTLLLYGSYDHVDLPAQRRVVESLGAIPALFLQTHVAVGLLLAGLTDEARRIIDQWAPLAEQGLSGLEGPGTVAFLSRLVITVGAAEHAPLLRQVLEPFRGLLPIGNGIGVSPPHRRHPGPARPARRRRRRGHRRRDLGPGDQPVPAGAGVRGAGAGRARPGPSGLGRPGRRPRRARCRGRAGRADRHGAPAPRRRRSPDHHIDPGAPRVRGDDGSDDRSGPGSGG